MEVREERGQRNFVSSPIFDMCLTEKRRKGMNGIKTK